MTETLRTLITQSPLKAEEQNAFITILSQCEENTWKEIEEICIEDPSWIERFFKNYSLKKTALVDSDTALIQGILEQEEQLLNRFEK